MSRKFLTISRIVVVIAVIASIWIPVWHHYHIDRQLPAAEAMASALTVPESGVLSEIGRMALGISLVDSVTEIVPAAEKIVGGTLNASAFGIYDVKLRGYPEDLRDGPPSFQLAKASLGIEAILLGAFEKTHDTRFLNRAAARIVSFADYESRRRMDQGFLWNDHAIAARVAVLARLWKHVRDRPDLESGVRYALFGLAVRSGRLLTKPTHFTVRTNHGVMQNIALLQLAAAFPTLPESDEWRNLAAARLAIQLPFYVSAEGVILEHSAEYHRFGYELLLMATRLCVLNGLAPSHGLVNSVEKAREFLALLRRPDGTLPAIGNTKQGAQYSFPSGAGNGREPLHPEHAALSEIPPQGAYLFPLSGYSVWWDVSQNIDATQTVIAWAKHDGHGHKHADEATVSWWSNGVDWLTNTGYWPYGERLTDATYGWEASNAPHEVGEAPKSARTVRAVRVGDAPGIRFIEIERANADGARFNRQVIRLDDQQLVVVDFSRNVRKGTEIIWTPAPVSRIHQLASEREFATAPLNDGRRLEIAMASGSSMTMSIHRGSAQPFAGWVAVGGKPTPTDALRIVRPQPDSAVAAYFRIAKETADVRRTAVLSANASPEEWDLTIESVGGTINLIRTQSGLNVRSEKDGGSRHPVTAIRLVEVQNVDAGRDELMRAYANAVNAYPQWRDLTYYRARLSGLLVLLGIFFEIAYAVAIRRLPANALRYSVAGHALLFVGWLLIGVWATFFYLR